MTHKRLALIPIVVVGLALAAQSPVGADHCAGESSGLDDGGEVTADCHLVAPGSAGEYDELSDEEKWNRYCYYQIDSGDEVPYAKKAKVNKTNERRLDEEEVRERGYDPTGTYGSFIASCIHPDGIGSGIGGEFHFTIIDPIPLVDLRAIAKARITIGDPEIDTNPSFVDRFTLVNIETWLWAEPSYWEPKEEAETAGFVTVEVFATPQTMTWVFSDGTSTRCDGPGRAWTPGSGDAECGVIFTTSSAGEQNDAYRGHATVDWVFTWTLNGADQGEFDDPFLATTDFELQVGEIQAVES